MFARAHVRFFVPASILMVVLLSWVVQAQEQQTDSKPNDVSGTWKWSYEGFGGQSVEVTLKLKQEGEKLTGTITSFNGEETPIQDGKVNNGEITFKITRDFGGQTSTTTYTGKLDGQTLKGKSETVFSRDFEAKRG